MESEKTIEELKLENENLTKQLQEMNEKIKNLGAIVIKTKEYNVKLAYSVRLLAEAHLTRDEKMAIAKEFDNATSAEQVERIYKKYMDQICPPGVEIEKDFMWSPGFVRDLEKYYFNHKGYNPFEVIESAVKAIRIQFKLEDELAVESNPEKIKKIREAWTVNKTSSLKAVDDIFAVTNEILKR